MRLRLREVRERKLVTQDELAERTGLSVPTISRLENGHNAPRIRTVRTLAEGLGVDPEELIIWPAEDAGGTKGEMGKAAA